MKSVILSFLVLCAAVAWAQVAVSPIPPSCAILDINWNLFDVSSGYYNASESNNGNIIGEMSMNLCLDMEKTCSHSTNEPCSVCQFRDVQSPNAHSYCIGYSKDEVYGPLPNTSINIGKTGFRATLKGDSDFCPGNAARVTNIDVQCNAGSNFLQFVDEAPTCTYNFLLRLAGNCAISNASFTPTFTVTSITPNSFNLVIDDGYPYEFWNYNVQVNGKTAYKGNYRDVFVENLDPATTYRVVVERVSGYGAITPVFSPSVALSITTLPTNIGAFHSVVVSGTGSGIIIGVVIAALIAGLVFGFLKLRQTSWWADKFGGSGGRSGKGFSLMDAEKSTAFDP